MDRLTLVNNYPLHMRNKFIKEIENIPPTTNKQVIIKWSLEDSRFDTSKFHPSQANYKISIEELDRVDWNHFLGDGVLVTHSQLLSVQQSKVFNPTAGQLPRTGIFPHFQSLPQVCFLRQQNDHGADR